MEAADSATDVPDSATDAPDSAADSVDSAADSVDLAADAEDLAADADTADAADAPGANTTTGVCPGVVAIPGAKQSAPLTS